MAASPKNKWYFGDKDLAGDDIEGNTRNVLEQIVVGPLRWERLALTAEQVEAYNLPKIIKHDRRFANGGAHLDLLFLDRIDRGFQREFQGGRERKAELPAGREQRSRALLTELPNGRPQRLSDAF